MSLAAWRSPLVGALHRNRSQPHSRYFQLATLGVDGLPANRTVVFRGFFNNTDQLIIITDSRSEKTTHIACQPWAEACWYFTKTREQFRISGQLAIIDDTHNNIVGLKARQDNWQRLSRKAQAQFYWPNPGAIRTDNSSFETPQLDPIFPPTCFCLLLLNPVRVDHLELKGSPQTRHQYHIQSNHQWCKVEVNP